MLINKDSISIFDLILGLSQAVDLVSPLVANHHKRVAYIAFRLSCELELSAQERKDATIAGALHDVGGLSLKNRLDVMQFEINDPYAHCETGHLILKTFEPFSRIADIVRFHHTCWENGAGSVFKGNAVPDGSHILHLADRVAVLINPQTDALEQSEGIIERIEQNRNGMFVPRMVDAFTSLAAKEYFWLDTVSPSIGAVLRHGLEWGELTLGEDDFLGLTNLFRRIIDFRSPFTAAHSSGVAATAEALARLAGMPQQECLMMRIAGHFHDIGKLSVPAEILEKPAKLTKQEYDVIRGHTYYTGRILESIPALDLARTWGSQHHERLDGSGYPFHLKNKEISLGSRIMAVADVFVAISEDRPYRKGMTRGEVIKVLQDLAGKNKLDLRVVSMLQEHFDGINAVRLFSQAQAAEEYGVVTKRPVQ